MKRLLSDSQIQNLQQLKKSALFDGVQSKLSTIANSVVTDNNATHDTTSFHQNFEIT